MHAFQEDRVAMQETQLSTRGCMKRGELSKCNTGDALEPEIKEITSRRGKAGCFSLFSGR